MLYEQCRRKNDVSERTIDRNEEKTFRGHGQTTKTFHQFSYSNQQQNESSTKLTHEKWKS